MAGEDLSTLETVADALQRSDSDRFEHAAWEAARLGPAGERLLAEAYSRGPLTVVAFLGDAVGDAGADVLRQAMTESGRGSQDVRCAATLALAKRFGADATGDLLDALASRDGAVREYALIGLAGAGDGRAWEAVVADLRRRLGQRRSPSLEHSEEMPRSAVTGGAVCTALAYLGQHAVTDDQFNSVHETILRRWDRLGSGERAFIDHYWRSLAPGSNGPVGEPPNREVLRAWARESLFDPVPDFA